MAPPAQAAPRLVVFDLDDTLYLERDYVRSGFAAVALAIPEAGPQFERTAWALFEAGVRGTTFDQALAIVVPTIEPAVREALVRRMIGVYRAHAPDIALLPDAEACLRRLRSAGVLLGLVTDGPRESQQAKISALRIADYIPAERILLTAALGPDFEKPSARPFALLEEMTGASGRRCVYLGDNPRKDFAGPRSLGWNTVRVRRPGGLHWALPSEETTMGDLGKWGADPQPAGRDGRN